MEFDWNKLREEAAKAGTYSSSDKPWINIDDEWQRVLLDMGKHKEKEIEGKFGKKTKHFMWTVEGNPISFTTYQFKKLMEALPEPVPDVWHIELKIGIDENKKPVLKVREVE